MGLKFYAQISAAGLCVGMLETGSAIDAPHMIPVAPGDDRIGQRWDGQAWNAPVPTNAEQADAELRQIDEQTGMARTLRETLIAVAKKVGADVAFLEAQEAKAAAARLRRKAG